MSLPAPRACAWSLAKTLMTCIVLIRTAEGFTAMPEAEFDGVQPAVVYVYDPSG